MKGGSKLGWPLVTFSLLGALFVSAAVYGAFSAAAVLLFDSSVSSEQRRFSAESWKVATWDERGLQLHDLTTRVLHNGMTVQECVALLDLPPPVVESWTYDIPQEEARDADRPVQLVVLPGMSYAGAATLVYAGESRARQREATDVIDEAALAAAQATVLDGGVERWCRNAPGDRLVLAEAFWIALNHDWPNDASLDALHDCGEAQYDTLSISVGRNGAPFTFEQVLSLRFDGDRLSSWSVWRD